MGSKENVFTCPSCHSSSCLLLPQRTKPDGHTCPKDKKRNWADYSLEGTFIRGDLAAFKQESYYQSSPVRVLYLSKAQNKRKLPQNEARRSVVNAVFPPPPCWRPKWILSNARLHRPQACPVLPPSEPHPHFLGDIRGSLGICDYAIFFCSRKHESSKGGKFTS